MDKICWSCREPKDFPSAFNAQGKTCLECHKNRERERRANNRASYNAYIRSRRKRKTNVETVPYSASPSCADCGKPKEKPRGSAYCTACAKKRDKKQKRTHYERNKQSVIEKAKAKRKSLLNFIRGIKKEKQCAHCGCRDYRCLTFHHTGEKNFEISEFADNGASKAKILAEIEKCIVLCANCHMIEHFVE